MAFNDKHKITAIVLTKNEEGNIIKCLKSISWCDSILVIDDYSTDKTISLAQKMGARVIKNHLENDFSKQRNFALRQAQTRWVFFIDADERISKELASEAQKFIQHADQEGCTGAFVIRQDSIFGQKIHYGEFGKTRLLRLGRRVGKWQGKVHEIWTFPGRKATLKNPLYHYPHPNLTEFLGKINFYTTLRAEELYQQKIKTNSLLIIFYPLAKFFQNYCYRFGFLEGTTGFVLAALMSFHSFLVRAKLWVLWRQRGGWQ